MRGIHRPRVNAPHKGQWLGTFMFLFDLRLNKRLSKQWWGWWFETQSCPLWRHCSDYRNDTALRPCYLYLRNACTGKTTSSYWEDFDFVSLVTALWSRMRFWLTPWRNFLYTFELDVILVDYYFNFDFAQVNIPWGVFLGFPRRPMTLPHPWPHADLSISETSYG